MTDQRTPSDWPPRSGSESGGRRPASGPPWYTWYVAAVAAILLTILVLLIILVLRNGDDGQEVQTVLPSTTSATLPDSTTTTGAETTATTEETTTTVESTTTSEPTTTEESTTTTVTDPFVPAVWPLLDSSTRYDDPVDAARDFATELVGFDDPVIGPFLEGDGRSGEVEVRAEADGPGTTVLVRQLGPDDTWWVIGAATTNIEITEPEALAEIASPLVVRGRALAFEGVVDVELRADGGSDPLVTGSVTGGGTELAPFEGSFEFEWPDEAGGAVLLRTMSPEDGRVWEAAVVRIRFPLAG